jgi:hypothetical protein
MARRHKPKWGWDRSGWNDIRYLDGENEEKIYKVIGSGGLSKSDIISFVQDAIRELASDEHYQPNRPTPSEVKSAW